MNKDLTIFSSKIPKLYSYRIINEFDHDISSYTQGLEFDDEYNLYESTGQYGYSSLIKIDYKIVTTYMQNKRKTDTEPKQPFQKIK